MSDMTQELADQLIAAKAVLASRDAARDTREDSMAAVFSPRWGSALEDAATKREGEGHRADLPPDGTGIRAKRKLAQGLFANTTTPGRKWMALTVTPKNVRENGEVKRWLAECSEILLERVNASNFSSRIMQAFEDIILGNTVVFLDYRDGYGLRFKTFPRSTCRIARGPDDEVMEVYREFAFSPAQAVEAWGDSNSQEVKDAAEDANRKHSSVRFLHVVRPRAKGQVGKAAKEKPYESFYVDEDNRVVVEESGYDSMPYIVARFYPRTSETWGEGPAMDAEGDTTLTQKMANRYYENVEYSSNPAWLFDESAEQYELDFSPGAVNYINLQTAQAPMPLQKPVFDANFYRLYEMKREDIRDAFMLQVFAPIEDRPQMTATEFAERTEQNATLVAPIKEMASSELLSPLILRAFMLLELKGHMPERPQVLKEPVVDKNGNQVMAQMRVEYLTRLDARLAQVNVAQTKAALEEISQFAQAVADLPVLEQFIDFKEFVEMVFAARQVPPEIMVDKDKREEIAQRQEEAREKAKLEEFVSDVASKAPTQPGRPGSPMGAMFGRG